MEGSNSNFKLLVSKQNQSVQKSKKKRPSASEDKTVGPYSNFKLNRSRPYQSLNQDECIELNNKRRSRVKGIQGV